MEEAWRFAGRTTEVARLKTLVSDPSSHGVMLAGPSGVGVTRLCEETLALAADGGLRTLRMSATEAAATIPFGAMACLPTAPTNYPPTADGQLRGYVDALNDDVEDKRLVLAVDDAHLLDPASAAVVLSLARTGHVFVVTTVLSEAPCPDAVLTLWKDGVVPRIDVPAMTRSDIAEMLRAALGARLSQSAVAHFYDRCRGDLVLLRELVRGAVQDGMLRRDRDGFWTLTGPAPLTSRLCAIVEARLHPLGAAERAYLEVVAIAQPAGPIELTLAGDVAIADNLQRRGLLTVRHLGRRVEFEIAHPLQHEVIRSGIPAMRAMTIATELAERLQASGTQRPDDIVRMAKWRMEAGNASPSILLEAAEIARWRLDLPLAERLAVAAAEDGAGFEAELLVGQLAGLQGRISEAEEWLQQLEARADNDDQRGRLAMARIDNLIYDLGRPADALAVADEAEAALAPSGLRDEVTARRLALLLAIYGPRAAAEAGEVLVHSASGRALAWGCVELAYSWGRLGRLDDALTVSQRGLRVHQDLAAPFEWSPWMHRFLRCENLAHRGDLTAIEKLAETEHEKVVAAGDIETQAFFALYLAKRVGDRGHVARSIAYAEEALNLFRRLGRLQMIRFGLIYLALGRALAGQADAAATVLDEIDEMRLPPSYLTGIDLYQARAWTAAASGEILEARKILAEGARVAADIGDHVGEAAALHGVVRLGGTPTNPSRLHELCGLIDGDLVAARARHVDALSAGDARRLIDVSQAFESMGADLLAAEASVDAAVAWRRTGDAHQASAASWRAHLLANVDGRAVTPALTDLDARAVLTRAQRDVAVLAAAGRNNHEIAEQLAVSVRTVENHLHQVYRKLGLRRSELAGHFSSHSADRMPGLNQC